MEPSGHSYETEVLGKGVKMNVLHNCNRNLSSSSHMSGPLWYAFFILKPTSPRKKKKKCGCKNRVLLLNTLLYFFDHLIFREITVGNKRVSFNKNNAQRRDYLLNKFSLILLYTNIGWRSNLRICLQNMFLYIVCLHKYKTCTQFMFNMRKMLLLSCCLVPCCFLLCVCASRQALSE